MTDNASKFANFVATVNEEQQVFALQNPDGDWVVCDSAEFEDADVMPIWSSEKNAQQFCIDEWQGYHVGCISLELFLEEWINDLNEDGVLVGVEWQIDSEAAELDAIEFAKLIVKAL